MNLIPAIDALLPQTQCGKCGHPGCRPYAEGLAAGEAINKCPPGGEETLAALASLLGVPPLPLDRERGPAPAQVAYIREAECIGCTKCIQACPVDAILGAAKLMHTVLIDQCTGCDLCVAPCPVDCIEMHPLPAQGAVIPVVGGLAASPAAIAARNAKRDQARERFERRTARLQREEQQKSAERLARLARTAAVGGNNPDPVQAAIERVRAQKAAQALAEQSATTPQASPPSSDEAALKKAKIDAAMTRAQLNKSLKAFGSPPTEAQHRQLGELYAALELAERRLAAPQASPSPAAVLPALDDGALKRAKIQLALRRSELKKAQVAEAPPAQLAALQEALHQAEQALHAAEDTCGRPAPDLVRTDKRPIDPDLRALKTELAYARAELSKLQRRPHPDNLALQSAQARLARAQAQLAPHGQG
ncbi:MAG TPA: electron transport complex subunit RsxB [Pseudomonas sp.]|nr:electron transport complex subunit RsxB [Pseudomonas sp.]